MRKVFTKLLIITLTVLLSYSSSLFGQKQLQKQTEQAKTLYEAKKVFNEKWDQYDVKNGLYMENGKKTKAPGWKIFKRAEYYWEQRVDLKSGEFPKTTALEEYQKVEKSLKKTDFTSTWTNLGMSSSAGGYSGIGRINCIAFHPTDVNTIWVGSPSGGIWRTTNANATTPSWTILNNNEQVLGVSDIAITSNYSSSNTLYIATGDRDKGSMSTLSGGQAADNVSVGVYKSENGGGTWTATGLTFAKSAGVRITRLLLDPNNNSILYAAVNNGQNYAEGVSGIYRSANGGTSWTKILDGGLWGDMEFKPGDPTTIYVSGFGKYTFDPAFEYFTEFKYTTNSGTTWSATTTYHNAQRGEIAVTAANPAVVYLLVTNGASGLDNIYKSTNSGASFSPMLDPAPAGDDGKSFFGYESDGSGDNTGQGGYDICIAASPTDENEIYIGGVNTWKYTTAAGWKCVTHWSTSSTGVTVVHADKHSLAFQPTASPSGSVLWEGNDGGIYKVTNAGATWEDKTNGMVISQIYRIGLSKSNPDKYIAGLQDNGTKLFNGTIWTDPNGGDGMECIIDYNNPNYMFSTYTEGQIALSTDGATFPSTYVTANIPGGQPKGAWVTPYVMHPTTPSTLFVGYDKVWKTTDRGVTTGNWSPASQALSGTNLLRSLAIAPSDGNVLYTADQTNMWKTTDGGATNWTSITLPTLSNSITYIAVHATNPNIVWFTVGGYTSGQKVYQSTDGGANWTNISGVLPNLPIMSIVHYKKATDRNVLFVSTDLGVYVSEQALPLPKALAKVNVSDWALYNTGLPNVVVSELEIYYAPSGSDKLRAGTFGRGLWETNIDAALPVELTSFAATSIEESKVSLSWETATEVNNYGFDIERQSITELGKTSKLSEENWKSVGFLNGSGNSNSPKKYSFVDQLISGGSNFAYRLKQIDIDGSYEYSDVVKIKVVPTNFALQQNYPNPFNPMTKISYSVPSRTLISLSVFDVLGREIVKLVNEIQEQGVYEATFDASQFPSGIYFYSLQAAEFTQTRKMMLLK